MTSSSSVVLGFVDESFDAENDSYEPTFYDTYFGGQPTFASSSCIHAAPECRQCSTTARFILQAYNSIDDSWHLQLFLYACSQCTTWFVKRCVVSIQQEHHEAVPTSSAPATPLLKQAFGFEFDDDWGSSSASSSLTSTPQTTPIKSNKPTKPPSTPIINPSITESFNIQYIQVDFEPDKEVDDEEELVDDVDDSAAVDTESYLPEDYEASDPFSKFLQRLDRGPGQVCRYGGKPLWPSTERPSVVPPCSLCGAPREFELQILPTLLTFLMPRINRVPDFGSVFIYTCHCVGAPDTAIDEFAFVVQGQ